MKKAASILKVVFVFLLLTVLTQIGGLIYLFHRFVLKRTKAKFQKQKIQLLLGPVQFVLLYLLFTFAIVPPLARTFGRTPLPVFSESHLSPHSFFTCLLNRHYVRPQLKKNLLLVSEEIQSQYNGIEVNYLDANFPFIDGFPLLPHLSHNDGKKIDLSFFYKDKTTGQCSDQRPSPIGYGICEEPLENEVNTALTCQQQGRWQYSILKKIVPEFFRRNLILDEKRTAQLINHLVATPSIQKIFIEPHLKNRMKLVSGKIRFHGCQAVRHDDHIHVEME
jgi:hypothetical protein